MRAKFLIVGGGVVGTAVALHLARRCHPLNEPVVLVERRQLGSGSSGRSAGLLYQRGPDRLLAAMARDSLREYAGFQRQVGRSLGFRRTGVLTLAGPGDPGSGERLNREAELLAGLAVEAQLVDTAEIRKLVRGVTVADGTTGLWEPGGGYLDPHETIEAFAALARTYGAVTRLGVTVQALLTDGGRVTGVETSEGPVEAQTVILAAGPWTRPLLAAQGLELPLQAVCPPRHCLAVPGVDAPEPEPESPPLEITDPLQRVDERLREGFADEGPRGHPVVLDLEHGFYAREDPHSARMRVGLLDPSRLDPVEDLDQLDELPEEAPDADAGTEARTWLCDRLPAYRDQPDAASPLALHTLTPDGRAFIGPAGELEALYVAAGFAGRGFRLAPAVGLGLSQMVFGEPVSAFDPDYFAPARLRDAGGEDA